MERYSFLHGTEANGTLVMYGGSKERYKFFGDIGATDPRALQRVIQQNLNGFTTLPEYEKEPADMKPVAVRYAPMHLYRKKEMASIRAFCAMNISGSEKRDDRESSYDHTFVFSVDEMRNGKEYSYLDHLFGTKLTGWQEVKRLRDKEATIDYDRPPQKVNPEIKHSDKKLCIRCVEAIYAGQNIVIRTEKGHNFNNRSREILMQIYSLIQPRLAIEVGFAAYQAPERIASLANELSMRIFVIPATCSLDAVPGNNVILDLADETPKIDLERNPLTSTLVKWLDYSWERRLAAFRSVFKDVTDYQNAEILVQRSEEFFEAENALNVWKSSVKRGSVSSMAELWEVYAKNIEQSIVPWAQHEFEIRIPGMIASGKTIGSLLTDEALRICTCSGEQQKEASELYLFGRNYGSVEVARLSRELTAYQEKVTAAQWQITVDKMQKDLDQAALDLTKAVSEEQQKAAVALAEANAAAAVVIAQEQEKTRAAKEETVQAKAEGEKRVAEEQQKAAAVLAAANAAAEDVLEREKERARTELHAAQTRWDEDRNALIRQHNTEIETEKKKYDELRTRATEAYTSMKGRAEQAEQDLADTKTALGAANVALNETKKEYETKVATLTESGKAAVAKERRKAKEDLDKLEVKIAELQRLLKVDPEEVTKLRKSLQTEKDTVQKMKGDLAAQKRKGIIGFVAGVLAGTLICGAAFGLIGLLNKEEELAPTMPPQTIATTAPVETEPMETAVPVTTEPVQIPEEFDWTDTACVEQLLEAVPALKTVDTENAAAWLPEGIALRDDYAVMALLSCQEELPEVPEEGTEVEYMLVLQRDERMDDAQLENTDADFELEDELVDEQQTEIEQSQTADEQDTAEEETQPVIEDEMETTLDEDIEITETTFDVRTLEGITMSLESRTQVLLVFGGEKTQEAALQVFSRYIPDEESFAAYVYTAEQALDVTPAMIALMGDAWWEQINIITTDAEMLKSRGETLGLSTMPVAFFAGSDKNVYFFEYGETEEVLTALKEAAEASEWEICEFEQYAAVAVSAAEESMSEE